MADGYGKATCDRAGGNAPIRGAGRTGRSRPPGSGLVSAIPRQVSRDQITESIEVTTMRRMRSLTRSEPANKQLTEQVRALAQPLREPRDLDPLLDHIGTA